MDGVVNTIKGGKHGTDDVRSLLGTTELADPAVVTVTAANVACGDEVPTEEVESLTTGETSLTYTDVTSKATGSPEDTRPCYAVGATTTDGSSNTVQFTLR